MVRTTPIVEAEFTLLKRNLAGTGQRASRRYRCDLATLCRVTLPGRSLTATGWVHDLSKEGVSLILTSPLEVSAALCLRLKSHAAVLEVEAAVIHCTPEIDGNWRIGCSLARKLTDDELDGQI